MILTIRQSIIRWIGSGIVDDVVIPNTCRSDGTFDGKIGAKNQGHACGSTRYSLNSNFSSDR